MKQDKKNYLFKLAISMIETAAEMNLPDPKDAAEKILRGQKPTASEKLSVFVTATSEALAYPHSTRALFVLAAMAGIDPETASDEKIKKAKEKTLKKIVNTKTKRLAMLQKALGTKDNRTYALAVIEIFQEIEKRKETK